MNDTTLLAAIKDERRITHNKLDNAILANIAEAKDEMVRAGIPGSIAYDTSRPLIARAVKSYCQSFLANDTTDGDKYMAAFRSQLDNLRKSSAYNTEEEFDGE